MYVTRSLSLYKKDYSPWVELEPEPEGPNTGVLVMDEDEVMESTCCFGLLKTKYVNVELEVPPFPQNKMLQLRYTASTTDVRKDRHTQYFCALLIPVINQPLSSNQYYVIQSSGNTKGLPCTSSKEDEMSSCCWCCLFVNEKPPQLFDPKNAYQQFQISNRTIECGGVPWGFVSKSVAPDGIPPYFLGHEGWGAYTTTLNKNLEPMKALGLDGALRARLPDLNKSSEAVVVGKWYCPFIFVRDGDVGSQMSNSPYYEMTLQQKWKEIFGCGNLGGGVVEFDVCVEREAVSVAGRPVDGRDIGDGVVWFGSSGVGLSLAIVERVEWEEERGGFRTFEWGGEKEVRVKGREEYEGLGEWRRFGCYALVERFVLKRMDGSLVLTWEFRHTHQITTKWE